MRALTHLDRLEAESIHILRETVAEAERPVMLYSIGKDSAVMLHLARKAFFPSPLPFPLLHVDTGWKFQDMYALRDKVAAEPGIRLIVHKNPEAERQGINPFDHGPLHTDLWKTEGLKQALDEHGFDAAFGGARRDEEKSRAKERIFSFRGANHRWDPKRQRPELWSALQCPQEQGREPARLPLVQLDRARRVAIYPARGDRDRAAVLRRRAADGRARRADPDGRRRALAAWPGRAAANAPGPLPDARLLSADRRDRERRGDASRTSSRRCCAATSSERQGRAIDRDAGDCEHGEEEAGGLFLMELLRFITCGSVDDGKSTLIGRLLYDSRQMFDDQLAALEADSKRVGTQGGDIDFALLVDGLSAEREQGITIDVAYRYFASAKRKFIVADTPGHEQYTRNMVTGASTAELAVLLVDARKGVLTQTRRHSYLAHLLGIRHFVLAVTKMDLVDYDQAAFDAICADYRLFADSIGIDDWVAIPVSGLKGDNVVGAQRRDALVQRPEPDRASRQRSDRCAPRTPPSRCACRCNGSTGPTRISAASPGQIASGTMGPGTEVRVLPSGRPTRIERIVTLDGDLERGGRGPVGDGDARRRGRLLARRRDRRRRRRARGRRPVRGDDRLDGRARADPGPRLLAQARHADGRPRPSSTRNMRSTSTASSISRRRRWR